MVSILRTDSSHPGFVHLVKQLDDYLTIIDGEEHGFYDQFNQIDKLEHVVVLFQNNEAIACGAIKPYDDNAMEVKRMFVVPNARGKGLARQVLAELEAWAKDLGYTKCLLETGKRMPDAIGLYEKSGYQRIPNYGQYQHIDNSVCFEKVL